MHRLSGSRSWISAGLVTTLVASLALALGITPAQAGVRIATLPQANAADFTPRVVDDATVTESGVRVLRQVGSTMYAGGAIHTVLNAARTTTYIRHNLFSFDATTGAVTSWAPVVDGRVFTIDPSRDGRYLYIGGDFHTFDGQTVNRLVKYDLQLHRVDPTFTSTVAAANITDVKLVGNRLFVAGVFPGGIVALDPTTGARDTYLDPVAVTGAETNYSTRVYRFAVNPAGDRMVIIGSFTAVGGLPRQQVAMIHLGTTASVSLWSSTRWDLDCAAATQWYSRGVDWAPDGSYFAIGTAGGGAPRSTRLCDTVTRWNPVDLPGQQPVWINYSGGDTFQSVRVSNLGVFAGGHFRWLDNPLGKDSKGPGAVDRLGLGLMSASNGKALAWNPTKSVEGGQGAFDLYFTSRGLWVGHYERYLGIGPKGRELHEGLGLLPYTPAKRATRATLTIAKKKYRKHGYAITGRLTNAGKPWKAWPVGLWAHTQGQKWHLVTTHRTNTKGNVRFLVTPKKRTWYQLRRSEAKPANATRAWSRIVVANRR